MPKLDRYHFPKVKDFMTQTVVAFDENFTAFDVLKAFNSHRISAAPVLRSAESKEIVGFVTEQDCMECIANNSFYDDRNDCSITEIMSREILMVNQNKDVFDLEQMFKEANLRHAPVVDDSGNLVGMVSRRDIMRALEGVVDEMKLYKEKIKTPHNLSMMQETKWKIST